jgi:serine/threonine protein kinase
MMTNFSHTKVKIYAGWLIITGTNDDSKQALDWEKRYKIAQGISCGLRYVHEESIYKMVHRDLKPANILLDKDMNPKISDFGTAEFFVDELTHKFTMKPIWTR